MTVFSILYTIIISPIETFLETVFCFELSKIGFWGVMGAIISVSLVMNFLAFPIYNVADKISQKQRVRLKRLEPGIKRIKAVFFGDERFMMLQTFYKENHYSPFYAFASSLSIIIEVPFFIAAYHFLSNCPSIKGQSFAFLKDLSSPDALLPLKFILPQYNGGGYLSKYTSYFNDFDKYCLKQCFLKRITPKRKTSNI